MTAPVLSQWRNYNFCPPGKHSLHSLITVLIHNSGHFGPFTVLVPCLPPGIAGAADGYLRHCDRTGAVIGDDIVGMCQHYVRNSQ